MTVLDVFAILVMLVLAIAVVAIWVVLAMLPGKIARQRGHPQAEAVNVCGWLGGLTLGLLLPVAFVWAYLRPPRDFIPAPEANSLEELTMRVAALEKGLAVSEKGGGDSS